MFAGRLSGNSGLFHIGSGDELDDDGDGSDFDEWESDMEGSDDGVEI